MPLSAEDQMKIQVNSDKTIDVDASVTRFVEGLASAKGTDAATVERDFFKHVRPSSLLKRFATTDEVAAMVAYVASVKSSATNGAALRVDGGVIRSIL